MVGFASQTFGFASRNLPCGLQSLGRAMHHAVRSVGKISRAAAAPLVAMNTTINARRLRQLMLRQIVLDLIGQLIDAAGRGTFG